MGNLSKEIIKEPINEVLEHVNSSRGLIVIKGQKGSGKTTVARQILASGENCLYLESHDFDFLCKSVSKEELVHFIEMTLSKKIFTYLLEEEKELYTKNVEDLENDLSLFYLESIIEEKKLSKMYGFMTKINETLKLINKKPEEITVIFDDFHRIPDWVQEVVREYKSQFNKGIITIDCADELISREKNIDLINLDYTKKPEFITEYVATALYHRGAFHLKNSHRVDEYNEKVKNQYLEILKGNYLGLMINKADGNLHKLDESLSGVIAMVKTYGYENTQKNLVKEFRK